MTVGGHYDVKDKLMDLIVLADTSLSPKATHVLGHWRPQTWELTDDKMPIVTVRIGPVTIEETSFGRKIRHNVTGTYAAFFFTLQVWAKNATITSTVLLKEKDVMVLADKIVTYLKKYSGDATSGIAYFRDVSFRGADPEGGPLSYSRVIIDGFIFVKRPFT